MSILNEKIKAELIQIYQMESDNAGELSVKNHILNQIKAFEHNNLVNEYKRLGKIIPPMDKLPILNAAGNTTTQIMINVNKALQLILVKHYKYNTNISEETREYLDIKINNLYKKIGKAINKKHTYQQRVQSKYTNQI